MSIEKQLEEIILSGMERGETAGGAVQVTREGKEILFASAGYADHENQKPYERDTIFRAYSMTKPITAAAAMILVERGLLDIGQNLSDYIPEFANVKVYTEHGPEDPIHPITIRDLFAMTSGLVYNGDEDVPAREAQVVFSEIADRLHGDDPMGTVEFARKMAGVSLAFQPRTHYRYGTSADILGAVIELCSGMRFGEFMKKEIFDPLDMKDTGFWVPEEKQDRLAKTYLKVNGNWEENKTEHLGVIYERNMDPAFEAGGAGLVSTLNDYTAFGQMLLHNGSWKGTQILAPKTVELMTSPQLTPNLQQDMWNWSISRIGYNYGFLNRVLETTGKTALYGTPGEYGWDGWLGTYYCNDPVNKTTVVFATQVTGAGSMSTVRRLKNRIASALY